MCDKCICLLRLVTYYSRAVLYILHACIMKPLWLTVKSGQRLHLQFSPVMTQVRNVTAVTDM